jgi:hypothetical protein
MDRAILTWDVDVVPAADLATSVHPLLERNGYYCLVAAHLDEEADLWGDLELLFVGGAAEQTLRTAASEQRREHAEAMALADRAGKSVVVMLGELSDSTLGRKTRRFLDDIEQCLALRNGPAVSQIPSDFVEARHLSVVNRGDFAPLKWRSLMTPA